MERIKKGVENKKNGEILDEYMATDMEITGKGKSPLKEPRAGEILLMKMHGGSELAVMGENGSMEEEVFIRPHIMSLPGIGLKKQENQHMDPEKDSMQERKDPSPTLRKTWKRRTREGQVVQSAATLSPKGK